MNKPENLVKPFICETTQKLVKPFTIKNEKSTKCETNGSETEFHITKKMREVIKSYDNLSKPIEFLTEEVSEISENLCLPLQSAYGNNTKTLAQYMGLGLQYFKNTGHEIPCILPAICQNPGHSSFNFELKLNKKIVQINDTATGEKRKYLYYIDIKLYLQSGEVQNYFAIVDSDKIKTPAWLNSATHCLAKLPNDKDEKIELTEMIQKCIETPGIPEEIIFPNAGWRFIADIGWRYVYGSGAIGIQGNFIHTKRCDEEFVFPPNTFQQSEIFKEALNMTKICKHSCASTILWLFTHASTISTFFEKSGYPINFILGIVGVTNSRKTSLAIELTRIFRQSKKMADAEFTATIAGIEKTLSKYKDGTIFIDDFHPGETRAVQLELNKKLEALVRFYGNRVPKKRMDDYSGAEKKFFPIQGACVITMELIAGVQSSLSRMMLVEIDKNEVQNKILAYYQERAWILSTHIFDFLVWATENQAEIIQTISNQMPYLRTQYHFEFQRFGEMFAVFHLIAYFIASYAQSRSFWTSDEYTIFNNQCDYITISLLKNMELKFKKTDKGFIVLHALTEAIETKKIQPIKLTNESCKIKAIAYEDERRFFIQTDILKKIAEEYCAYLKIEIIFISEDEIISVLDRLEVLEVYEKGANRERSRKLPIQRGNHLRYLYIVKAALQNKINED